MKNLLTGLVLASLMSCWATAQGLDFVPNVVQMPGTQPNEVGNFESPNKCDNCHAGYNLDDPGAEPATGWRGAAMGNAGRDPIFWATLAVAEQDFDGAGDLCIRCHSAGGWYGGRSVPTDGSGLAASDDDGIDCDTCHSMTNPDDSDPVLQGEMFTPFIANCSEESADPLAPAGTCQSVDEGYYGSGILSLWGGGSDKLGPYDDAEARHQFMKSAFHRSVDFCGSCHDVSNPVVGDLAPNNGTQQNAPAVIHNGGLPIDELADPTRAAFNNPPYAYGIVERTFSEYKASAFPTTRVGEYDTLPTELQAGSIEATYQAAIATVPDNPDDPDRLPGDYADGDPRYFSCQSCHMRPTTGAGCDKNGAPIRTDLPRHDHTGGNYWFADMAKYQDGEGTLRLGGDLNASQRLAMDLGQQRAVTHLTQAASLEVLGNTVRVNNLTGHKLITGYPEGRRMWLRIQWFDAADQPLGVDGDYGPLVDDTGAPVMIANPGASPGDPDEFVQVESILDLDGSNTEIYEAHYAMTQPWAAKLLDLGYDPGLALSYDRYTGAVDVTLGGLAGMSPGAHVDTFHFALNNHVTKDNRIPPYGMSHAEAQRRNALPVPEGRYNKIGDIYNHFDVVNLIPPPGAEHAHIELLYQGTSWEYIQFLQLANNTENPFLGQEGVNMLDAWINAEVGIINDEPIAEILEINGDRKMVPPVVMATATWTPGGGPVNEHPTCSIDSPAGNAVTIEAGQSVDYAGTATDTDGTIAAYSWTFEGGSPAASGAEDPGPVTYDTPGVDYLTSFTATDNEGAACAPATVLVTVTGAVMACPDYGDATSCEGDPACDWVAKGKKGGSCQDAPLPSVCDGLDQGACDAAAECRWSKKNNICLTR